MSEHLEGTYLFICAFLNCALIRVDCLKYIWINGKMESGVQFVQ